MRTRCVPTLVVALFAAALASPVLAEDAGGDTGSDSGDNGMTPNYGDSWYDLQAQQPPRAVPNLQIYENADPRGARLREQVRMRMQRLEDGTSRAPDGSNTQVPSTAPDAAMSTSPQSSHD
jgi:hypothetical protein